MTPSPRQDPPLHHAASRLTYGVAESGVKRSRPLVEGSISQSLGELGRSYDVREQGDAHPTPDRRDLGTGTLTTGRRIIAEKSCDDRPYGVCVLQIRRSRSAGKQCDAGIGNAMGDAVRHIDTAVVALKDQRGCSHFGKE